MFGLEASVREPDVEKTLLDGIGGGLTVRHCGRTVRQGGDIVATSGRCTTNSPKPLLRLALVTGASAEDRVKPEQHDSRDHGDQKDSEQLRVSHHGEASFRISRHPMPA